MESIERGIHTIDEHTKNAIQKHKEILAKTIFDTAKKSNVSLQSFEKQCLKIFPNIDSVGTDDVNIFNPHTVIEFREGKSYQVIESWNKDDGLLPDRKTMGKYYVDKLKNDSELGKNISKKKYYIPEHNASYSSFYGNISPIHNYNVSNYTLQFSDYKYNLKDNYDNIAFIEQNSKVISKYLNSLSGENIINRGESRDYIFDFDRTITFEVDNYLNLFHKPTGLYLMFNKTPFPLACFYFAREYNQLPNKEYYQIFLSKRVTDFDLQFTHQNYQSLDNRSKLIEEINTIVPDNYNRIFKLFDNFRNFQSFKSSGNYDLTKPNNDISQLDPKDRIIEGLKFKLNETIKRCENSEKIISDMIEEYNKKSIKVQEIERERSLLELQIKEMKEEYEKKSSNVDIEIEKIKIKNKETIINITEEKDRELMSLYSRLNNAEAFKAKTEELGISMSSLQKQVEQLELNKHKLRDINNGIVLQLKQEKDRNSKLSNDNDELLSQITKFKSINDELVNKNIKITKDYEEKINECWSLNEKLGIMGQESSNVLENALSDQLDNMKEQLTSLKSDNKKLTEEKNKVTKQLDKMKNVLSNLME